MLFSFRLLKILVGFIIALLIIRISTDYFFSVQNNSHKKTDIDTNEIKNLFISSLSNYDISDDMIKSESNDDYYFYNVKVYSDVPIELLLLELERNFVDKNVQIKTKDSVNNQVSYCSIYSNEEIKLSARLSVDKSKTRNKGKLSFLIKVNDSDDLVKEIVETPEPISFLIIPDKSFQKKLRIIKESDKKYFVLINSEIKDLIYKFGRNYSKLQTKNAVYNILRDFEQLNKIFIHSGDNWLDSNTIRTITYELKRNKIFFYDLELLNDLTDLDEDISKKVFSELSDLSSNDKRDYVITPKQYLIISKLFPSMRKTGYQIVSSN